MSYDPYIVIGTGRSGSSTVARILHNKWEVFMGYKFREPNENNPNGFWEDVEFASPNWRFLNGKITYPEWIESIFTIITERKNQRIPWGFKDPDATHFLGLYLSFFENPRIIRCKRNKELVVKSLMRCFGHTAEEAENIRNMKEMVLDNILLNRDYLTICFNEQQVSDMEIIRKIEEKWGGSNYQVET